MHLSRGGAGTVKIMLATLENDLRILKLSLQNILEHGWIQDQAGSFDEGMCTMGSFSGAISKVVGVNKTDDQILREYGATIECGVGYSFTEQTTAFMMNRINPFGSIPAWNDAPERTEADVIALLRATIDNVESLLGIEHDAAQVEESREDRTFVSA